ncbi:WGxxGxxG family protein [Mycobacterium fragae]|uniref:WGxxGxxG family protein n=2 Tax=Mycobacterium fragae TaxID=1260918 RepID=UPI0027DEE00D|nr:WGxxGxxG family protein [Mycobacterium fragae]
MDAEDFFRAPAGRTSATGPVGVSFAFLPTDVWRFVMRKILAITAATGALLLGGAGIANATTPSTPPSSSTTTTVAQTGDADNNNHSDKTGLWGLLGLAGLAGLAGLTRRRNEANAGASTTVPGTCGQTPRA